MITSIPTPMYSSMCEPLDILCVLAGGGGGEIYNYEDYNMLFYRTLTTSTLVELLN